MRPRNLGRLLVCAALVVVVGLLPVRGDDKKEHSAIKPVPRSDKTWEKKHESFVAQAKKGGIDLLLLGDAMTDMWGGEGHDPMLSRGLKIYEKEFLPLKAANFGSNADRTQHLLWRLQNGELDGIKPKVVMLMIGTNNTNGNDNTVEEIADGIKAIVAEIHKKSPETKVLLLGIFPRGLKPNAQRDKIKAVNELIAKLDDGGKTVKYLDLTSKFLDADGTLPKEMMYNTLHLTEKAYQVWADAVKGPIKDLMDKK